MQYSRAGIFSWSPYLNKVIAEQSRIIPKDRGVLIGWDAGEAQNYIIHSFICTDWHSIGRWATFQPDIMALTGNREVKYSRLNDITRSRAVPLVLAAAEELQGMLLTLAIQKHVMRKDFRHDKTKLSTISANFKHRWKSQPLWNACVIADTINHVFSSTLPNAGELGVSFDQDDTIWGSSAQREDFGRILRNWYDWTGVEPPQKEVRLSFDDYTLGKCLTSIPDLISGAVTDILNHFEVRETSPTEKALTIGRWIWSERTNPKSAVVVVEPHVNDDGVAFTHCAVLANPFA